MGEEAIRENVSKSLDADEVLSHVWGQDIQRDVRAVKSRLGKNNNQLMVYHPGYPLVWKPNFMRYGLDLSINGAWAIFTLIPKSDTQGVPDNPPGTPIQG